MSKKLDVTPYKGVRDFYPEDKAVLEYIFSIWSKIAESFGYERYSASLLEPSELYKAKSGEELVNEQTYTFKDRGDREVTLRPEMTPTVARMVAGRKRGLSFPLRWYSIENFFRYEQPQRGRFREHYQLNMDIFGVESMEAELELLKIVTEIFAKAGAKPEMYEVRINSRELLDDLFESFGIQEDNRQKISKILDKKDKVDARTFKESLSALLGENTDEFIQTISKGEHVFEKVGDQKESAKNILKLIDMLSAENIQNVVFTPTLVRGLDYYDGIVFEVYDTNPENRRSIFGGGRYNNLLALFGGDSLPAVGFGLGDVTFKDFLETHKLLPTFSSKTDLYVCLTENVDLSHVSRFASELRQKGVNVAIDYSGKKLGDQIKTADKKKIPYIVCVGDNEINNGKYKVKKLLTGEEAETTVDGISTLVSKD